MNQNKAENKSQKTILLENIASLSILQWVNYLVPLFLIPFLVRSLGIELFGLVMFAQSLSTIFIIFSDFGFTITGTRKVSIISKNKKQVSEIFWSITTIKIAMLILLFCVLIMLIASVPKFSSDPKLFIYSFGATIGSTIFPSWFFQGIQKMKVITLVNATAKLIFAALVVVYVTSPEDYLLVPLFNSAGFILAGVLGLIYATRHVNFVIPTLKNLTSHLRESAPVLLSSIATTLYTSSNVLILGFLTNNTITGVYASLEKVVLALKGLYTPIYQAIFPWLSQKKDKGGIIIKISYYVFFIGIIGTVILILFSNQALSIMFDNPLITSFSLAFRIFSVVFLISGLNMLFNYLYLSSTERYGLRLKILGITGLFSLFFTIAATYFFGIYGTVSSVVLSELILLFWGYNSFYKLEK